MFIDKYSQVSRILNPLVLTLKAIGRLCEKPDVKFYVDRIFGGAEQLRMLILTDFFRHAFDGTQQASRGKSGFGVCNMAIWLAHCIRTHSVTASAAWLLLV